MQSMNESYRISSKQKILIFLCLSVAITTSLASSTYVGFAASENKTLMQPQGSTGYDNTNTTNMNIVSSSWRMG